MLLHRSMPLFMVPGSSTLANKKRRENNPAVVMVSRVRQNLHPDVEHVRQLDQRHRRDADDGGDHRRKGAVAAAIAAHLP